MHGPVVYLGNEFGGFGYLWIPGRNAQSKRLLPGMTDEMKNALGHSRFPISFDKSAPFSQSPVLENCLNNLLKK